MELKIYEIGEYQRNTAPIEKLPWWNASYEKEIARRSISYIFFRKESSNTNEKFIAE